MRAVLGIDAAWTAHNPSGVALVVEQGGSWRLAALSTSYADFYANVGLAREEPWPGLPDAAALLAAAKAICGRPVTLVAIDMPLSKEPIAGRRVSDRMISSVFGAKGAATHSPSALRPGAISDRLRQGFGEAGYPLLTETITPPGLIEVYPHPALIALAGADRRLPYKLSRARRYWPAMTPAERRLALLEQWRLIATLLENKIVGMAAVLPPAGLDSSLAALKAHEDALDAVICAWVGVCALEGAAQSFGDQQSAIWVPDSKRHGDEVVKGSIAI